MSSIFSEIDIPFVVCVIYWSLPTSGSPQEIAWNGPKLVYDCAVWAAAVVALILCPPHLGICFKLICIVFRGVAAGALILPALQAGDAVPNPPREPQSQDSVTAGDEDESPPTAGCLGAAIVNVDGLRGKRVHGKATDKLLMRPLSARVLSSAPGPSEDALHLNSIEFHSTGLVYNKYVCFN